MRRGISDSVSLVWRYTIEPLIEEQLFGDEGAIDALRWGPVAKRIAPTAVAVSLPDEEVPEADTVEFEDPHAADSGSSFGPAEGAQVDS